MLKEGEGIWARDGGEGKSTANRKVNGGHVVQLRHRKIRPNRGGEGSIKGVKEKIAMIGVRYGGGE